MPFIVRWPGRVKPGVRTLIPQVDFRASLAGSKKPLAAGEAPDSVDTPAALLGTTKAGRTELVEQAGGQALRVGQWKYIEASKRPRMNVEMNTELGNDAAPQLYDLGKDRASGRTSRRSTPRVAELKARPGDSQSLIPHPDQTSSLSLIPNP